MSTNSTMDHMALAWVKKELDETLQHARQALESYVEAPDDPAPLHTCLESLHQVAGTLQMMQLSGATLLAEEMEQLAKGLSEGAVRQTEDAYEVLMRAILQLPDYLDELQSGQADSSIILLPLLNELRAVRGENLFSELLLFTPDLSIIRPSARAHARSADGADIRGEARKLRHRYQVGLLGWYRGQDAAGSLKALAEVVAELEVLSGREPAIQLWWVAGALIEALSEGGLESTASVNLLLGQLDRQIKRLIDEGEEGLANSPPAALVKNLLYYVAQARSRGARVREITEAFHLRELMPGADELSHARERLSGPNTELLRGVASVLKEDLASVKDALDIFMRAERPEPGDLAPLAGTLRQVIDTLRMLGLDAARRLAQEQVVLINDIAGGNVEPTESRLLEIARALLLVESSLDDMPSGGAAVHHEGDQSLPEELPAGDEAQDVPGSMSEAEFRHVVTATLREAETTLGAIKEAILSFVKAPDDYGPLAPLPQWFHEIQGSLRVLSLERAANLLEGVGRYVTHELLERRATPSEEQLDVLADAITSIDWYLELTAEQGEGWESVLDKADESIALLGYADEQVVAAPAETAEEELESGVGERFATGEPLPDTSMPIAFAMGEPGFEPAGFPEDDAAFGADDLLETPVWTGEIETDRTPSDAEAAGEDILAEWVLEPLAEESPADVDLAGATEELVIESPEPSTLLDEWNEQPGGAWDEPEIAAVSEPEPTLSDTETLTVGIEPIPDEIPLALAGPAADAGPEGPPAAPLPGEPASPAASAPAVDAPPPARAADKPAIEALPPDLDEDILDVFIEEAEEELDAIKEVLPRWQSNLDDRDALTRVRRSFHTLKGSGRLVGARLVGEFAWAFENMLNRVIDGTVPLAPIHFRLLQQATEVLHALIGQLKGGPAPAMDVQGLIDQAGSLGQPGATLPDAPAEAEAPAAEAPATAEPEADAPESGGAPLMDPVLYEIYSKEAYGHLEEIERFVDLCTDGGAQCQVTDALVRALHTLHGSSRMAGVAGVAEIGATLERYVKAYREAGVPVNMDGCIALTDGVTFIRAILALLNVPGASLPAHGAMQARLTEFVQQALLDAKDAPAPVQPSEVPEGVLPQQAPGESLEVPAPEPAPETDAVVSDAAEPLHEEPEFTAVSDIQEPLPEEPGLSPEPPSISHMQANADEPDLELLEIFLDEGDEIIDSSEVTLQRWIQDQDNPALVTGLQRDLHTLKGGARMVGIAPISDLSHTLESLLTAIVDGRLVVSKRLFDVLQRALDRLSGMLGQVRDREPVEAAEDLVAELALVQSGAAEDPGQEPAAEEPKEPPAREEVSVAEEPPAPEVFTPDVAVAAEPEEVPEEAEDVLSLPEERRTVSRMQHEMVRVRADLLDNLVNYAGEVSIYRSRLEQQVGTLRFNLAELDQTVERLRDQLRRLELETEAQILARYGRDTTWHREDFDPLEMDRYSQLQQLSRALGESVSDLGSIQGLLENTTRESATLLLQQSRVNTELQEGLMRTRMVPFAGLGGRLRRIVRQACLDLGKQAELHLVGAEGEIDRTVLDRIVAPLEHMLRNAVSHGIELPEERAAAGKPEGGNITLSLVRDGAEVVIQVSDDGAGLNLPAIRRKAVERGLLRADAEVGDHDLLQFIMEAGFSTAETITQISGRGVGMDVVSNEIKQLGGSLEIYTQPGRGTRFTIRLPFTLAISQALLVHVGEETYAVPLSSVEGIVRLGHEELERHYADDAPLYEYAGQGYQVRHLGSLLNLGARRLPGAGRRLPALLVRTGDQRAALVVEGLQGSREIVVKPVGAQLSTVRGISGATILGDGRVVLILDLGTLVRLDAAMPLAVVEEAAPTAAASRHDDITVMVVDDSITVRKITMRLLERHDMKVLTAKDGVDALAVLQEHRPDVMLLDIEMPRMDGYELATHIRNDERLHDLPIIMITSRTGDKHRQRAMEIGVDRYLGKPYQEADLVEQIRGLLAEARARETVA